LKHNSREKEYFVTGETDLLGNAGIHSQEYQRTKRQVSHNKCIIVMTSNISCLRILRGCNVGIDGGIEELLI
jgi:hypothetical protein